MYVKCAIEKERVLCSQLCESQKMDACICCHLNFLLTSTAFFFLSLEIWDHQSRNTFRVDSPQSQKRPLTLWIPGLGGKGLTAVLTQHSGTHM